VPLDMQLDAVSAIVRAETDASPAFRLKAREAMFGTFRYLLASMVVLTHLWPAQTMWWGVYAVFCFYLVSGYLMTLVLASTYPYTEDGMARYAGNRVLRIYPPYIVVCGVALVLIHFLPEAALSANHKLVWPDSIGQWLSSFLIFGQLNSAQALVPPAWSLNIELVYYILMALVLSRGRMIVTLWFLASCAYTVFLVVQAPANFPPRYSEIAGASLPFAFGAMLYTYRAHLGWIRPWTAPLTALLFVGNVALAAWAPLGRPSLLHYYVSLLLGGTLLVALAQLRPADLPRWYTRLDRLGGNLSYPIFLCHFHVAVLVVWLGFDGVRPMNDFAMWAISFALTHPVAYGIYVVVDRNADRLRDRIRRRQSSRDVAHAIDDPEPVRR
jgi:peptidoglycan/LPS O-acetylase OafA/YrhL